MANDNFTGQLFGGNWTEKKLEILEPYAAANQSLCLTANCFLMKNKQLQLWKQ